MSARQSHRYPSRSPSPVSKSISVRKRRTRSLCKSSEDSSSNEDDAGNSRSRSKTSGSHSQSKQNKKKHKKKKSKRSRRDSCSSDNSSSSTIESQASSFKKSRSKLKKDKHSTRRSRHLEPKKSKRLLEDSGHKKKHKHGRREDFDETGTTGPAPAMSHIPSSTTNNTVTATPSDTSSSLRRPMTKEEYEKQQSVVRRVLDPETGRHRLVRGDGEIIEEIVSKERHRAINKQATLGDGLSFQSHLRNCL